MIRNEKGIDAHIETEGNECDHSFAGTIHAVGDNAKSLDASASSTVRAADAPESRNMSR